MVDLICEICGSSYATSKTAAARGSRYCSSACRVAGVSQRNVRPLAVRFWSKVDRRSETECWPWTAGATRGGYGAFNIGGKIMRAPRVAYELTYGPIPDDLIIRHSCDNPTCVNPRHLETGTHAQNSSDKVKRGRSSRSIKLTDSQVHDIRSDGRTHNEIAAAFGVSKGLVSLIRGSSGYRGVKAGRSCRQEKFHG